MRTRSGTETSGREPWRTAVAAFLAGIILAGSLVMVWTWESRQPQVALLASGGGLSMMITTASSRVLIASGDDPDAFFESLDGYRRPTRKGVDLLLVWGTGEGLAVANAATSSIPAKRVYAITPIARPSTLPALRGIEVLPPNSAITIDERTHLSIRRWPTGTDKSGRMVWGVEVVITASASRVRAIGGPAPLNMEQPTDAEVLLIGLDGNIKESWDRASIIAIADDVISGKRLRTAAAADPGHPDHLIRVFPGDPITVTLVEGAVSVPRDLLQPTLPLVVD